MKKENPFKTFGAAMKAIRERQPSQELINKINDFVKIEDCAKPPCPSDKNKVETPKTVYSRKSKHKKQWS